MDDRGPHARFVHSMSESKLYPHGKPEKKIRKSCRIGGGSTNLSRRPDERTEKPYSSLSKEGFVFGNAAKAQKAAAHNVSSKLIRHLAKSEEKVKTFSNGHKNAEI